MSDITHDLKKLAEQFEKFAPPKDPERSISVLLKRAASEIEQLRAAH